MPFDQKPTPVPSQLLLRVQDLFRTAVRQMRGHLVNRVGVEVPVRFGDVATVSHMDLLEQFSDEGEGVYVRFSVEPGGHHGVLAIDGALLFRIMGLLLGEDPWAEPAPFVWRPPTRMDRMVARRLASDVFSGVLDSLPKTFGGTIEVVEVTGNPRVDLPLSRTAQLLDATLDFGPPEDPFGLMTMALPLSFAQALWPEPDSARSAASEAGVARVLPLPITTVAELARVRMSLGDVHDLQVGQVIDLGARKAVTMSVADRASFTAEAGVVDGTRCVRILNRLSSIG